MDLLNKLKSTLNISEDDIASPIYTLDLSKNNSNCFIVQMDKTATHSLLNNEFIIKGLKEQSAVLCSTDRSYDMIQVDLTSTLICLPNLADLPTVQKSAVISEFIELKEYKPSFKQLYDELGHVLYAGEYNEENYNIQQDLLDLMRCTHAQLFELLKSSDAFEYNGFWRIFDSEFIEDAVMHMCRTVDSLNVSTDEIPFSLVLEDLCELYNSDIIDAFMTIMSLSRSQGCSADVVMVIGEDVMYSLDLDKICRHGGLAILRRANQLYLDEFMAIWSQAMPFPVNIDQLKGVAVVNEDAKPKTISSFKAQDLSENVSERFRQIFKKMRLWSYEQLQPYINGEETDLLRRFTRSFNRNNITYYTCRVKLI